MIHFLEGILASKNVTQAVLNVNGVGYELTVSLSAHEKLPRLGETVRLLTYLAVREDSHQLYGFADGEEREIFRLLIGVSGIGPKSAINILSGIRVRDLKQAIVEEDSGRLSTVPGIGKKTAERIVVELKEKIEEEEGADGKGLLKGKSPEAQLWNDALMALISLGYNQAAAQKALKKAITHQKEAVSVEELVRKSLQNV